MLNSLPDSSLSSMSDEAESKGFEKNLVDKRWYLDFGVPFFKQKELIMTKLQPSNTNYQEIVFQYDGTIKHDNKNVEVGQKYGSIKEGEWGYEDKLLQIKAKGTVNVEMKVKTFKNDPNDPNFGDRKLIETEVTDHVVKREFIGFCTYYVFESSDARVILKRKGEPYYKEKIIEDEKNEE